MRDANIPWSPPVPGGDEAESNPELPMMDDAAGQLPEENAIRDRAMRLLASREHSRLELERKLRAKGFEGAAVARALDDLIESDLVSNERMAEAYVTARARKGIGPQRLRQELRERGVENDLIAPLLDRDADDWAERLAQVAEKKFGPEPVADPKELARRARFLEYRGFPSDLVRRYLRGDLS